MAEDPLAFLERVGFKATRRSDGLYDVANAAAGLHWLDVLDLWAALKVWPLSIHDADSRACPSYRLCSDRGMRRLAPEELRFSLWFALSQLPRGLVRDFLAADRRKREVALNIAADRLVERFDGHEVLAPDPAEPD